MSCGGKKLSAFNVARTAADFTVFLNFNSNCNYTVVEYCFSYFLFTFEIRFLSSSGSGQDTSCPVVSRPRSANSIELQVVDHSTLSVDTICASTPEMRNTATKPEMRCIVRAGTPETRGIGGAPVNQFANVPSDLDAADSSRVML